MRGYPKRLNTKADYEYAREHFPTEQWLPDWQKLLDTMRDWVPVGEVESADAGVTDDTHKVVESTAQGEDGEDVATYTQYELQVIPTCRLLRLGFEEDYVASVVAGA
ncbi:MAG: hypothetical protein LUD50_02860 [Clostridia bacterium]|nr:hypothetical protein [Clostridia bacterium]